MTVARMTQLFAPTFAGDKAVRVANIRADEAFATFAPDYGLPAGNVPVTSYLAVPVIGRAGRRVGALVLGHSESGAFSADTERLIAGIAVTAASAIDNARCSRRRTG